MFENRGFRFSDAAVAHGVHCSPGKTHWIIHSREKWQTRDISQSPFLFRRRNARTPRARSSSRDRLWERLFEKKKRSWIYLQPPLGVRGIIQTARIAYYDLFLSTSVLFHPRIRIHSYSSTRSSSHDSRAWENKRGGRLGGRGRGKRDRQVTQERGRPYSNASGANRARRWGIYIGFSQRDSDLLGIRPPVHPRVPLSLLFPRPHVPPLILSRALVRSFLCLILAFRNLWLLSFAPSPAMSSRHRNHRGKPTCIPRCRSNKSRADPRQLLGHS